MTALAALALAAALSAGAAPPTPPARRRALVVGVDKYGASPRWQELKGAANDARDVAELLELRFGYRPEDVTVLLDGEATREAILAAFQRVLVEPAAPGDLGVFYFAGHGSQVRNLKSPKAGQLDETIVPADGRDIRDVELGRLAEAAAGRGLRLTVVLDSCHSGTATRGLGAAEGTRKAEPDAAASVSDDGPRPAPDQKGVLVLTAARAEQLAGEAKRDGKPHGAFTAALLETLASSSSEASAEAILVRTHALVKALRPSQDPGLEGTAERRRAPPFSPPVKGAGARPVVAVGAVKGGEVELLGGAAMGLAAGATLVRPGAGRPPLRLTVTKVLGFGRSRARVALPGDGDPATLAVGDLLEVERWALAAPEPLRVEVGDAMPLAGVRAAARALAPLQRSRALRLVADPLETDPTHTLRWRGGAWVLEGPDGATTSLGASVDAARVERALAGQGRAGAAGPCGGAPCLFVRLPPPAELVAALGWEATPTAPVVGAAAGEAADYHLAGRLGAAAPEYALLAAGARAAAGPCSPDAQLPARSDWLPAGDAAGARAAAAGLREAAEGLGRVHAWLTLRAPQDDASFPWRLELTADGAPVAGGAVPPDATIEMALVRTGPGGGRRFPYVFAIDCRGAIEVASPEPGRTPPRLPATAAGGPERLPLGKVELDGTIGRYTFFLLASDEQLPSVEAIVQRAVLTDVKRLGVPLAFMLRSLGRSRSGSGALSPFTVERIGFLAAPDGGAP